MKQTRNIRRTPSKLTQSRSRNRFSPITPNQVLACIVEMAKGKATISEVCQALCEGEDNPGNFSKGSKVLIFCGIGAGYRGTYQGSVNGYAKVKGSAGQYWFSPTCFLQKCEDF